MVEGENPPVGLILCAERDAAVAHYTLENLPNKVLAAEYRTVLPKEPVLVAESRRQSMRSRRATPRGPRWSRRSHRAANDDHSRSSKPARRIAHQLSDRARPRVRIRVDRRSIAQAPLAQLTSRSPRPPASDVAIGLK
jgi:hypothetical protein